jgi:hypothetical protein
VSVVVKGDFAKVANWANKFQHPERFLKLISRNMAEEAVNLVKEGFDKGRDPYGKNWRAPHNLQITGRMRSYTVAKDGPTGFTVAATDQKAIWHHAPRKRKAWGGKALPTRLQVPINGKLPNSWSKRLSEAAQDVLNTALGG